MDDLNGKLFIKNFIHEKDFKEKTLVINEYYNIFTIKRFTEFDQFDSLNFYCPEDLHLLKSIDTTSNIYQIGRGLSSDSYAYFTKKDKSSLEYIDSISVKISGKSYHDLLIWKKLRDYPEIIDSLIYRYELNEIEVFMIKSRFMGNGQEFITEFIKVLNQYTEFKNIIWIRENTTKLSQLDFAVQINLIPAIINFSDYNQKKKRNRIKNINNLSQFDTIVFENLPRKIVLNDFIPKIKRDELKNNINIFVSETENCRK